jgi:hypothetical protein
MRQQTYHGYNGGMVTYRIDVCETTAEAEALMRRLAKDNEWVSVFWDRGWGDSGQVAEISVIVDHNGQMPKALLTPDIYKELQASNVIRGNTLQSFKARKIHDLSYCVERYEAKESAQ